MVLTNDGLDYLTESSKDRSSSLVFMSPERGGLYGGDDTAQDDDNLP